MKTVRIRNSSSTSPDVVVKYCDTFFSKLKGLMFTKTINPNQGVILVENTESRINTSIHMLFMNFDLTILWVDTQMIVVDKVLAKKWVPFYSPQAPAKYVIELHPSQISHFSIGDQLVISKEE